MKRFFIVAGEPSGDIHAARLMKALRNHHRDIEFVGIGGENMKAEGLHSLIPIEQMSVVGINEVIKKILFFREILLLCRNTLNEGNFDAFIPVDYPGFNLRLARYAKQLNIPVLYYIAPQLWAWGKNRTKKIEENVDLLLLVFPFEVDFYAELDIKTVFVGHPLLDDPDYEKDFLPRESRDYAIAIFPGSRKQEILKHRNLVIKIIELLGKRLPEYEVRIAVTKLSHKSFYKNIMKKFPKVIISDNPKELMKKSMAGTIKTGTSNLEAALIGLPINMFYKTSYASFMFGKRVVSLEHLSLINILLKKNIINEYIQKDANAEAIVEDLLDIIQNEKRYDDIQTAYREIRKMLGEKGASKRAAKAIFDYLQ